MSGDLLPPGAADSRPRRNRVQWAWTSASGVAAVLGLGLCAIAVLVVFGENPNAWRVPAALAGAAFITSWIGAFLGRPKS